jgi:hypothetical protein
LLSVWEVMGFSLLGTSRGFTIVGMECRYNNTQGACESVMNRQQTSHRSCMLYCIMHGIAHADREWRVTDRSSWDIIRDREWNTDRSDWRTLYSSSVAIAQMSLPSMVVLLFSDWNITVPLSLSLYI